MFRPNKYSYSMRIIKGLILICHNRVLYYLVLFVGTKMVSQFNNCNGILFINTLIFSKTSGLVATNKMCSWCYDDSCDPWFRVLKIFLGECLWDCRYIRSVKNNHKKELLLKVVFLDCTHWIKRTQFGNNFCYWIIVCSSFVAAVEYSLYSRTVKRIKWLNITVGKLISNN